MTEIFSIAFSEPVEGHEPDAFVTWRELRTALTAKGYSRDSVHRQASPPQHYVLLRHWRAEEGRRGGGGGARGPKNLGGVGDQNFVFFWCLRLGAVAGSAAKGGACGK